MFTNKNKILKYFYFTALQDKPFSGMISKINEILFKISHL